MRISSRLPNYFIAAVGLISAAPLPAAPATSPTNVIAQIYLSKPFHLARGASLTATQGPQIDDPIYDGETAPGRISLCVSASRSAACTPLIDHVLNVAGDRFSGIHYLEIHEIVHPRGSGAPPLIHLQVASLHAVNGSQGHAAVILAYRPAQRHFERIFEHVVGGNMNQEIRYIASGPLRGDMISAEPTASPPFGYWITVDRLTHGYRYREALRYRSATRYNDGNSLAVIDSEMPNILRRLKLWHPGQPLPLPKSACAKPRLVKSELWCS